MSPKAKAPEAVLLPIGDVEEDPENARQVYDAQALKELAASIEAQGLLQPILVRKHGKGWRVVAGHRRLRALQQLKRKEVLAIVQDLDDKAAALAQLTENLQREDLTPYEEAVAYRRALELGLQKKELGELAGVAFNTIKARLQLLELPQALARKVGQGGFSQAHAQILLPVAKDEKALAVALEAIHADAGKRGDVVPVTEAPQVITEALIEKKLAVAVDRTTGLQYAHDAAAKKRLEKLVEETGAFTMEGKWGHEHRLALRSPEVDEIVKAAKAKEAELKRKREASWRSQYATAPKTPEEAEKERKKRELELEAGKRAMRLQFDAIAQARDQLTGPILVKLLMGDGYGIFRDATQEQAYLALRAAGIQVREPKPGDGAYHYDDAWDDEAEAAALGIQDRDQAVWAAVLMRCAETVSEHGPGRDDEILAQLTGKKWSEWVSAAKSQIKQEASDAKKGKHKCQWCGKPATAWLAGGHVCDETACIDRARESVTRPCRFCGTATSYWNGGPVCDKDACRDQAVGEADDGSHEPDTPGPRFGEAGRCMECGCTEENACDPPCGWANEEKTLCDSPSCLEDDAVGAPEAVAELVEAAVDVHDAGPKAVACPDCQAKAGTWCKRPSGHKAMDFHASRKAAALELVHVPELSAAGAAEPVLTAVAEAGPVVLLQDTAGVGDCPNCGRKGLRTKPDGTLHLHTLPKDKQVGEAYWCGREPTKAPAKLGKSKKPKKATKAKKSKAVA